MCKHILNAQVAVRAPCCQRFFDCPQCHAESSDHPLARTTELAFVCKKCRRAFRKDLERFEEGSDEFCPHCDNCYVVDAKTSGAGRAASEIDDAEAEAAAMMPDARQDSSLYQALDPRQRYDPRKDFRMASERAAEDGERVDVGGLQGAVQQGEENEARMRQMLQARALEAEATAVMSSIDMAKMDDELDWS
ncbi:unnamed protein product [Parajaminaea phylloscopi]